MRLRITHRTEYGFDQPIQHALLRLRLTPVSGPTQTVQSWALAIEGAREEVFFGDQFGNDTRLVSVGGEPHDVVVTASGAVSTLDTAGVYGRHQGFAPLWLFTRDTALTAAGDGVREIVEALGPGADIERLHRLMAAVGERVKPGPVSPEGPSTAEEALARKTGAPGDQAHVFVAAAKALGFPARYVSGYLVTEDDEPQSALHAWAEAHVPGLGWLGFDVPNLQSPDGRCVRLASGRDCRDALPVSGMLPGQTAERLAVHVTVEQ